MGSGCATKKRVGSLPRIHGFVNLDALARQHPGWRGIGQYDAALQRLNTAANTLPSAGTPDEKVATLPAVPTGPGTMQAALSPAELSRIRGRLTSVQQTLVAELRGRREMARSEQLRGQRAVWRREARLKYPIPTDSAVIQPDFELQLLEANVATLTRTLNDWKESIPPAPEREKLREKVKKDRADLEQLIAVRLAAREKARADQVAEIERMRANRESYVQSQADALEARLRGDDERIITDHAWRLAQQQTALMGALGQPLSVGVPSAGDVGAKFLPQGHGLGQVALSQASLTAAKTRLQAQRARWRQYLYEDTQAAARDAAGQRNWDVTFGLPRPGDRDLTQPLAQVMTSGVWRL